LKLADIEKIIGNVRSPPVREAWIETYLPNRRRRDLGRLPCGRRGLKLRFGNINRDIYGRLPCGRRGLKLTCVTIHEQARVASRAGGVD